MVYDRHEALPVYRVRFQEYPGLSMRVRPASLAGKLAIAEAMPALRRATRAPGGEDAATLRAWRKLCIALGGALVDWTLVNSGELVPATAAGLMAQDLPFVMDLAKAWGQAAVSRPLPAPEPAELEPEPDDGEPDLRDVPMRLAAVSDG